MSVSLSNPKTRKYLYRVAIALVPIAVALGLITNEMAPLVITAVTSVLGLTLADVNVPTGSDV